MTPVTNKIWSDGYARVKTWIPEGRWTDIFTGDVYTAAQGGETKTLLRNLESVPVLAKAGTVLPLSADKGNSAGNPKNLELWCYLGDGGFTLYEDGTEDKKQGEFFTAFESENSVFEGTGVQSLRISSAGEAAVVPENRLLIVRFKDVSDGKAALYIDGRETEIEDTIADCVTVKFPFEAGKEYRVEVKYPLKTRTETLIARAKNVLIASEGDNENKKIAWMQIQKAESVEEYVDAVEKSKIEKAAKLRLKETL